jgi:hypothetical protein
MVSTFNTIQGNCLFQWRQQQQQQRKRTENSIQNTSHKENKDEAHLIKTQCGMY